MFQYYHSFWANCVSYFYVFVFPNILVFSDEFILSSFYILTDSFKFHFLSDQCTEQSGRHVKDSEDIKNINKNMKTAANNAQLKPHKRNSIICRKLENDRIEEEASVDIPMSTKTPKEQNTSQTEGPGKTKTITNDISTSDKPEEPLKPSSLPDILKTDTILMGKTTDLTRLNLKERTDSPIIIEPESNHSSLNNSELELNLNSSERCKDTLTNSVGINYENSEKYCNNKDRILSPDADKFAAISKSTGHIDRHFEDKSSPSHLSHSPHHHHHSSHHLDCTTHILPASPKRTIMFTSKDEKTAFFVKTVKSSSVESEEGPSERRDILIQTDVLSTYDDHCEKTKKKLLIKMKNLGSKGE